MSEHQEELLKLRQAIDKIDAEIIKTLARRFEVTAEVGRYKAEHKLPAQDPKREAEKFQALTEQAQALGLNEQMVRQVFERIIEQVRVEHRQLAEIEKNDQ